MAQEQAEVGTWVLDGGYSLQGTCSQGESWGFIHTFNRHALKLCSQRERPITNNRHISHVLLGDNFMEKISW